MPVFTEIWPLCTLATQLFSSAIEQKTGMIKIWLNSIISIKSWRMCQQSHNKCVDVTHWFKKHICNCIVRQKFVLFLIFPGRGMKSCHFAVYIGGIHHECKFTPKWYKYFLVQIRCSGCWKINLSHFWCFNSSFVLVLRW